jgi:hypothetical protein
VIAGASRAPDPSPIFADDLDRLEDALAHPRFADLAIVTHQLQRLALGQADASPARRHGPLGHFARYEVFGQLQVSIDSRVSCIDTDIRTSHSHGNFRLLHARVAISSRFYIRVDSLGLILRTKSLAVFANERAGYSWRFLHM